MDFSLGLGFFLVVFSFGIKIEYPIVHLLSLLMVYPLSTIPVGNSIFWEHYGIDSKIQNCDWE